MAEQQYFKEALADFVSEAAFAGAVRHLHDMGYSVEKIRANLTYPATLEQIRRVIKEDEEKKNRGNYDFVQEVDAYGRRSYRRIEKR